MLLRCWLAPMSISLGRTSASLMVLLKELIKVYLLCFAVGQDELSLIARHLGQRLPRVGQLLALVVVVWEPLNLQVHLLDFFAIQSVGLHLVV